LSITET